jgi:hypothetical protein
MMKDIFLRMISKNIVLKHTITLIVCNFSFKYFVHILNDPFKINLYRKIHEIIKYNRYYDSSYSDILIESGETTNILHIWIRKIRRFLPNDINNTINIR